MSVHDIPLHKRNIGYLYQDYNLFPHMTAVENIGYSLKMRHVPGPETRREVREIAQLFEVDGVLDQYPGTLSGGAQQRVALARALLMKPPLLLLDKPFAALDSVTKQRLYGMFRTIRDEFSCAVLFVTHDFAEAQALADRIGVLIGGMIRGIASSGQLYFADWDEDVRMFLGMDAIRSE